MMEDMSGEQLPHLETFSKAAEASSFTAAARALKLTQAAVSQRIQVLEKTLGESLFRRRGGRVLLTDSGRRLYEFAQRILSLHDEARHAITRKKAVIAGDLSLAASSVPGEHLLPGFLQDFHRRFPGIQVRVTVTDSLDVFNMVEHGKAQVGLVGGKSKSPHLEFRTFGCDNMVLAVPARHALAKRKQISLDQFCRLPLIVREAGSGSRWCLEEALARAGKSMKDLRIVLEMGSNEAIKEAILRDMGLSILSESVLEKEIQAGQLRTLRVAELPLRRDLFLVWDKRRVLPAPARHFLDFLKPCSGTQAGS